mgnify:CR=1 FL=1
MLWARDREAGIRFRSRGRGGQRQEVTARNRSSGAHCAGSRLRETVAARDKEAIRIWLSRSIVASVIKLSGEIFRRQRIPSASTSRPWTVSPAI